MGLVAWCDERPLCHEAVTHPIHISLSIDQYPNVPMSPVFSEINMIAPYTTGVLENTAQAAVSAERGPQASDNSLAILAPCLTAPGVSGFLDRDHCILAFNERVLDWAARADVPLLERLRYLSIVSSNLD